MMMTVNPKTYYLNFKPVEAMQWTVETCNAFRRWMDIEDACEESGWEHNAEETIFVVDVKNNIFLVDGQWLVKHSDGSLTIQNEEPAWLETWEWVAMHKNSAPRKTTDAISEFYARRVVLEHPDEFKLMRRPVVRTGPDKFDLWTGRWEVLA